MLLTDGGFDQIGLWRHRLSTRFVELVHGRSVPDVESYQATWEPAALNVAATRTDSLTQPDLLRFRAQLRSVDSGTDLDGHEQRARVLALRGLSQARDGEYERAQMTFASAARLDPMLDLALLPTFWSLSRKAHDIAVAALHDADRARDAAALAATIRTRFRPHPVRAINRAND